MENFQVPEGPPHLVWLYDMQIHLLPPEVIGSVAEGVRMNFYVTGGWFRGDRLRGEVLGVGGDWITMRSDGVGQLDVRGTLRTDDGALIYMWYSGLLRPEAEPGMEANQGEMPVGPFLITTAPMYRTAAPRYAWLNRVQAISRGWSDGRVVQYRVFAVDCPDEVD